ncbi:hypothetical protein AVEN_202511-1 [Araneus ventricosus]|uniref:Uncharacterized protein n=1 Tax=Araneus ventricosus TaxID=182803 RepID=A0A4Y2GL58_ARAVE|nr:hypothetical protein AVEN_101349-1 [Araneus ventricosus]GBM54330.1 hypothetical protein AVEN_202511-1 [Araneus ventricosus]
MIWRETGPIHGGSSVESGLEPGALRPQSRDLTTRAPRPYTDNFNSPAKKTLLSRRRASSVRLLIGLKL